MLTHDFDELYAQYPDVIAQLPETFTSHEFILKLAQQNQRAYVDALYSYRDHKRSGKPAPFMNVHGILAQRLASHPELVAKIKEEVSSTDIFGTPSSAAEWRKV